MIRTKLSRIIGITARNACLILKTADIAPARAGPIRAPISWLVWNNSHASDIVDGRIKAEIEPNIIEANATSSVIG
jgi:hypothetical protein